MDELKYQILTEVVEQMDAELMKVHFQTHGIDMQLFKEATHTTSPQSPFAGFKFLLKR